MQVLIALGAMCQRLVARARLLKVEDRAQCPLRFSHELLYCGGVGVWVAVFVAAAPIWTLHRLPSSL